MCWYLPTMYDQCKLKCQGRCSKFINEKTSLGCSLLLVCLELGMWSLGSKQSTMSGCKHAFLTQAHTSMSSVLFVAQAYMWARGYSQHGG